MKNKKLYSSLSAKKKDEVFINTIDFCLNTIDLSTGLKNQIRNNIDLDKMIQNRKVFDEMIKKQYVFTYKNLMFPLNIKDIKNNINI